MLVNLSRREMVSHSVQEALVERAQSFGIVLDDISLTHLTFGREFTEAVELKQVAQQEAERARFLVERAEQQKKAAIISAEGDAIGAELLSAAFKKAGNSLIELRKIEASEEISQNMAGNKNVVYLPDGQGVLMNLH